MGRSTRPPTACGQPGAGVVRVLDWHKRPGCEIASGALVPALTDWAMTDEVPPVNMLYPPIARASHGCASW